MAELRELRGLRELPELALIYRKLVGARIRADWQYRTSFLLFTISQFLASFLDFAAILVLFSNVERLAGWSVGEVLFLYGTAGLAFTLSDVFVSEVERASHHIKQGSFDQFLVRPLGPLFQLCCAEFALRRVGKVAQAVVVLGLAMTQVNVAWGPGRLTLVVVMVLAGFAIFGAVWVVASSISFWTVNSHEVANAFTYGGNLATQYPLEVFASWLRRLLVIVPLAFVNYYPSLEVLGRQDPHGSPWWYRFASPAVALAAVLMARSVWAFGVRHYRSTGS